MKSINQYPTPITEARAFVANGSEEEKVVPFYVAQDLERKLAACRDTVACINSSLVLPDEIHTLIRETLEATKP